VKSANLNGQIPADSTGQFVTNNMPQLYPRDAMMCARVLLLTGHAREARQVIEFWANSQVPMKSPGEWYARYDAHGKPVDAGTGARFDEPEWDANGYFIYLVSKYHESQGVWLVDRALIDQLAGFLVRHIGENGLLEEGGIVEWTGYLPATNMICSAALRTAAAIARQSGAEDKARTYEEASRKIAAALPRMFDPARNTYADVRFSDKKGPNGESLPDRTGAKTYLWDTTANVGAIWGYPNHHELEMSNAFYVANTMKLGGGMQYFDTPDAGLASYGHAVFFFTTAAASQYESLRGNKAAAKSYIDWMMRNANSYGLMPERIFLDESDSSPASPLSWCSAEFASALLLWSQNGGGKP
jgi:GH15 family glucan-1,4-alpha-glucosidase